MNQIINEQGSSLIKGLILASLLAGGSLIFAQMTKDQKMSSNTVEVSNDIEIIHSLIESTLFNAENCKQTLLGNSVLIGLPDPGATGEKAPINGIYLEGNSTPIIQSNMDATDNRMTKHFIKINNMNVHLQSLPPPHDSPHTYYFEVEYGKFERNENSSQRQVTGYGGQNVRLVIPIKFLLNDDGEISSCYAKSDTNDISNLAQELCSSFGPMFNWEASSGQCQFLGHTCPSGTYFNGYDSSGAPTCLPLNQITFNMSSVACPISDSASTSLKLAPNSSNPSQVDIICTNGVVTTPPPTECETTNPIHCKDPINYLNCGSSIQNLAVRDNCLNETKHCSLNTNHDLETGNPMCPEFVSCNDGTSMTFSAFEAILDCT